MLHLFCVACALVNVLSIIRCCPCCRPRARCSTWCWSSSPPWSLTLCSSSYNWDGRFQSVKEEQRETQRNRETQRKHEKQRGRESIRNREEENLFSMFLVKKNVSLFITSVKFQNEQRLKVETERKRNSRQIQKYILSQKEI